MKPSVKSLQARIAELEQKCEELEEINERRKKGAEQLSKVANSIYKWVAHINGGELKVPTNHMEITDKWGFKLEEDIKTKEYVLEVWGDEE